MKLWKKLFGKKKEKKITKLPTGIIINEKIAGLIKWHRSIIGRVYLIKTPPEKGTPEFELIGKARKYGEELVLYFADYKCEKCGKETELTLHHFVTRDIKGFVWFGKYESQRRYFSNIAVLCNRCHAKMHGFYWPHEMKTIDEKRIKNLKKRFGKYVKKN